MASKGTLDSLIRVVNKLKRRVDCLEDQLENSSSGKRIVNQLEELIDMTVAIFAGQVSVENSADPEYPETVNVVFRVCLDNKDMDIEDIIDRELVWYRQVAKIAPGAESRLRIVTLR